MKTLKQFLLIITGLNHLKQHINMKVSEIKAAVAEAARNNKEALDEIGKRVADLQKQIDDLVAGNSDPDVSDETFANDLASLQSSAKALAEIVPNPEAPPETPNDVPPNPVA